jgi:hypothetical protein
MRETIVVDRRVDHKRKVKVTGRMPSYCASNVDAA